MRNVSEASNSGAKRHGAAPLRFVVATVSVAILIMGIGCAPSDARLKPHKTLVHGVFYIGMTVDEALERLPAGCSLEGMPIIHEHPKGATADDLKFDEYFAIEDAKYEMIPLFFNQDKKLVRVGPTFDEEKYVTLYKQQKRKDQTEGNGGRDSAPK